MDAAPIADLLRRVVPGAAVDVLESIDMPAIAVEARHLLDVCGALRDHPELQFAFLADVTAVDRWPAEPRFEVVYNLACLGEHFMTAGATTPAPTRRLRVKAFTGGADPRVPTVSGIWATAGWPEREVFDLFGIAFEGHPDLRRVLMPDDWEGHPLRKDYTVQIRKEAKWALPLQLTPEEFARNVRAGRDEAVRQAGGPGPKAGTHD